jgi:hypothetical protein
MMRVQRPLTESEIFRFFGIAGGIGISIRTEYIGIVQKALKLDGRDAEELMKKWPGSGSYSFELTTSWGFNGVMRFVLPIEEDATCTWHALWPAPELDGIDQIAAARLSSSLAALCFALGHTCHEVYGLGDAECILFRPMICVPKIDSEGVIRCMLACTFSPIAREWIRSGGNRELLTVREAMKTAWDTMWGGALGTELSDFHASVFDGYRIHLSVPGNCACLGSNVDLDDGDGPIQVNSHNVDGPIQQLALFAGLVELSRLISDNQAL